MRLKELANLVSGKVAGDENLEVTSVSSVEEAGKGDLVFVLDNKHLLPALSSKASALVAPSNAAVGNKPAILTESPRIAMVKILALFAPKTPALQGIHPTAVIPKSCKIGKGVSIGAFVVLEEKVCVGPGSVIYPHVFIGTEARLGKNCVVHPHVSIYDRVVIGDRVILHSGCRLGVDGYGFIQNKGRHIKIPQIGRVVIEDDVELFANVCVSRGTLGPTIIGAGTKIDNLSHIAHNCRIGKDCAIVSLVGVAGSVTLGDRVFVAGQAGFNGHIKVGEDTVVMARAGVTKDIPANAVISGFPAQDHRKETLYRAALRRLSKKAR